ncbi:MAG: hypothetical protein KA715_03085 [Xanthomonadaceae bacterium]|nr:hypothetical protein [Xanthomonadaceae bacterium]
MSANVQFQKADTVSKTEAEVKPAPESKPAILQAAYTVGGRPQRVRFFGDAELLSE